MNRLLMLLLIICSPYVFAASSGGLDDEDTAPAKPAAVAPASATSKSVTAAPAKPVPAQGSEEDEDEDEDEDEAPAQPVVRQKLLSPATMRGRTGSLDDGNEAGFCRNCSAPRPAAPRIEPPKHSHSEVRITGAADVVNTPIWASFKRNFSACAPGCQPTGMGVFRSRVLRPKPSCHHTSQAIDVAGMVCDGVRYSASNESRTGIGRFSDMVRCMRGQMKTLYRVADHYDHAHFSNGCVTQEGFRMY